MIDFYLPKRKLAIEVDEIKIEDNKDGQQNKENKSQKELEDYLKCRFIRISPDEKDFSDYDGLGRIQTFIDKLTDEELEKLKN